MNWITRSKRDSNGDVPGILYLIDQLSDFTGGERALLNTIRLMPTERYRCDLVTFRDDPSPAVLRQLPCPLHIFPMRRTYGWNALKTALKLRRLIRTQKTKIVHTFFETSDLWGGVVAKLSGVPVLISSRRDMGILREAKHQQAYCLMHRLFDAVFAVSEQVRAYCIRHDGLEPAKVIALYNGVEIGKGFKRHEGGTLRAELGIKDASHIILTVASMRKVKGLDVFIRAAAPVHREFPQAVFLIGGAAVEQEYGEELRQLACSLDVAEAVRFLGERDDVPALLELADVFCLLSRSEGFSNALIEAMASSLACVATRVGGNVEALDDGRNGFLVPSEDHETAAKRISALLRDAELRERIGRAARATVEEKFGIRNMVKRVTEVYDKLLAAKCI